MTSIYNGQFIGNIIFLVGKTGCGKTMFLEELGLNKFFGNFPAGMQRPRNVLWRSPKGPNVQQKSDDLMKVVFFRCNSPCFTYLLLFLIGKTNMQSSKCGRPRDV